jgi:heme/copper-type cytochrome/quinol oxidase subunit 2
MIQRHHKALKFHTAYNIVIWLIFFILVIMAHDITLTLSVLFTLFYIVGNGIIHANSNELSRDTLIEYFLVSVIVLILIIGSLN